LKFQRKILHTYLVIIYAFNKLTVVLAYKYLTLF